MLARTWVNGECADQGSLCEGDLVTNMQTVRHKSYDLPRIYPALFFAEMH